jgi:hypothetical protein
LQYCVVRKLSTFNAQRSTFNIIETGCGFGIATSSPAVSSTALTV